MSIGRFTGVGVMLAISTGVVPATSQPVLPECSYDTEGSPSDNASVPLSGEYRALVVFAKFSDDNSSGRGWPDSLAVPPPFSDSLIASSPDPSSYPGGVFPEHTITRYFYDQSDSTDPFILYGDVYDEVIVTDSTEYDYYNEDSTGAAQIGGFGYLTLEVLSKIDPNVDFSDYDANGDGEIDYLFIVLRANPREDGIHDTLHNAVAYSGVSL